MTELLKTALHDEICQKVEKSIGIWDDEGLRLAYLASQVPDNGVIVEIGSFRGRSAVFMAAALREDSGVKIYCIDLWTNPKDDRFTAENVDLIGFNENIGMFGFEKFVTPIQGDSLKLAPTWDKPIDLLFIDGNHNYEPVKADYEAWYPHVKVGGTIAFHDYQPKNWPGVRTLINERVSREMIFTGLHGFVWSGKK